MAHRTPPISQQQLCKARQVKYLLCKSPLGHQTLSAMLRIKQLDLQPQCMFKAYCMLFKIVNSIKSNMDYVNLIAGGKNPRTFRYLIVIPLEAQQAKCLPQAGWAQQGHTLSRCKSANAH